ncbi:MAG: hypothetical protein V3U35_02730 [Candidatus Neomarinimicrobiota bacterium]
MDPKDLVKLRTDIETTAAAAAKVMQPLLAVRQKLLAGIEPMVQAQRRIVQALTPSIWEMNQAGKLLAEALEPAIRQFAEIQVRLMPIFKQLEEAAEQLAEASEHLPPRQRRALELLATDGWYLDPGLGFKELFEISALFEKGEVKEAREMLCEHFDSRSEEIETDLIGRFSERSVPITAAVRAHQSGEYALSVPVFLAQADGVCVQLIGDQLYARRDGRPRIAAHLLLEDRTPFIASLLYPLTVPMPISAGRVERLSLGDLLNRHAVLHGEATDYYTHANSCRALSLLAYVSWVLEEVVGRKPPSNTLVQ